MVRFPTSRPRHYPVGVAVVKLLCVVVGGNILLTFLQLGKNNRNHPSVIVVTKHEMPHGSWSEISPNLMPAEAIDSDEYLVIDNACLQANGPLNWTLRVKNKPPGDVEVLTINELVGVGVRREFVLHMFHVVWEEDLNINAVDNKTKLGTHMLMSHHATQNNFHLHNNFLIPVYRAFLKTRVNGLLLVEGCVDCWTRRLPMMQHVLDMMNINIVYPLEQAVSQETPMCFQRLVIPRACGNPFYTHYGRFSKYWPPELFRGYRDSVHEHFRTLSIAPRTENRAEKRATFWTRRHTSHEKKPVLSFLSRSSNCSSRCITNEQEAMVEFSKYFHVNLLDFSTGLTTEQAMSYIMETDVLIELHGAGLGYTSLLPDRAMVVELRSRYGERTSYFMNMASSLNLPYYAVSLRGPRIGRAPSDVYTLPSNVVSVMAKEIFDAHLHEKDSFSRHRGNVSTGECQFPDKITPFGHLSSTKDARCYLRQESEGSPWKQCITIINCKTY